MAQWWGKLDESNISYKNSSKDVIMNTSIELLVCSTFANVLFYM